MATLRNVPLKDIVVPADRFRREPGDCNKLARSIQEIGLIHPIIIDSHKNLIVGLRRLKACDILHMDTIQARVIDYDDPCKAERDENEERKDFTLREAKAVRDHFLAAEREKAKERQAAGKSTDGTAGGRGKKKPSGKFPEGIGRARTKASAATGYSDRTLDKVDVVVAAAEAEPEKYAAVAEEMDRTGKVDPAYKKIKRGRRTKEARAADQEAATLAWYESRYKIICECYEDLSREWRAKVRTFIAKCED